MKKKSAYAEFDAALLGHIRSAVKPIKMAELESKQDLRELADPHQDVTRWGDVTPVFRVIDRRLQSLRKAGMVRSTTVGWVVV